MSQAIKYQATKIDPTKSAMELSELVQKHGGTRFELRWEGGLLAGVRFAIAHPTLGEVPVRLPARTEQVQGKLLKAQPWNRRMRRPREQYEQEIAEQSYRIAWRHLRDLCEQLLVATSLGVIELHEGFLWAVEMEDPVSGKITTVGDMIARHSRALGSGGALMLTRGEVKP